MNKLISALVLCSMLLAILPATADAKDKKVKKERWLRNSGYGVMHHYEAFKNHSSANYNKTIDSFQVEKWADSLAKVKVGHVIFVIGQHWGKYCAPNSVYEKLLGVKNGEWTSKRDLIMEIGKALKKRNIKLILYMTVRAPMRNYFIIEKTGDQVPTINGKPAPRTMNTMTHPRVVKGFKRSEHQRPPVKFLKNWGEVCGEWSMRYGDLVNGWWFDGYKRTMEKNYADLQTKEYNVSTWLAGVKSGNKDAEIALNAGAYPGASLCTKGRLAPQQTYTAGEGHGFFMKDRSGKRGKFKAPSTYPSPDGVIWHLLFPLSKGWGAGTEPKEEYTIDYLVSGIDRINAEGGAITLDIPCAGNGVIPPAVLAHLAKLAKYRDKLTNGKRDFTNDVDKLTEVK